MNVMEQLRKQRQARNHGDRPAGHQPSKRARRVMAKAKAREGRPITLDMAARALAKQRSGPNWAQQFYLMLRAGLGFGRKPEPPAEAANAE